MNVPIDMSTPAVLAELNDLVPTRERPRGFAYAPADGSPGSTAVSEAHRAPIHGIHGNERAFSLDGQGFAVARHHSNVTDFWEGTQIRETYHVKEITGTDRVYIFDHTPRRRISGLEDNRGGPRQPAARVHIGHTAKSGARRVPGPLPDEADELPRGHARVINLWRPVNHPLVNYPVYDAPLAVADAARFMPRTAFIVSDAPADARR